MLLDAELEPRRESAVTMTRSGLCGCRGVGSDRQTHCEPDEAGLSSDVQLARDVAWIESCVVNCAIPELKFVRVQVLCYTYDVKIQGTRTR